MLWTSECECECVCVCLCVCGVCVCVSSLTNGFKSLQRGGESPERVLSTRLDHESCPRFLDVGHLGCGEGGEGDRLVLSWRELQNI